MYNFVIAENRTCSPDEKLVVKETYIVPINRKMVHCACISSILEHLHAFFTTFFYLGGIQKNEVKLLPQIAEEKYVALTKDQIGQEHRLKNIPRWIHNGRQQFTRPIKYCRNHIELLRGARRHVKYCSCVSMLP